MKARRPVAGEAIVYLLDGSAGSVVALLKRPLQASGPTVLVAGVEGVDRSRSAIAPTSRLKKVPSALADRDGAR